MSVEIVKCNLVIEGGHAYEDSEPRREGICGIAVYTRKVSPAAE